MKYVSIDLETSGLDPEKNQILEFGAILEDTDKCLGFDEIPKFSCIIERKEIMGQPIALNMNTRIINILSNLWMAKGEKRDAIRKKFNIIKEDELVSNFINWLAPYFATKENSCEDLQLYSYDFVLNIAGKNYASFDGRFLEKVPGWKEMVKCSHKIIDPATLYVDWNKDERLPSLDDCLKRAGIEKSVTHTAVEDAWDVIQVLRKKY
jgi:DNA polymerase III epsilon subunit-like protein